MRTEGAEPAACAAQARKKAHGRLFPGEESPRGCRILQKKREKGSVFLQNPPFPFIINGKGIFPRELTRKEKCA